MKILHTSDWHLGQTLYNNPRTEEHLNMLLQMVSIVKEEQPDVFLLCGDVYHTPQPSTDVQTLFTNALMGIHDANPGMTIVITAGNHDSGTKHEIFRTPWKALNVYTIGSFDASHKNELIIEIPGKAYVIAVPYINERNMPEGLFQSLLDEVAKRNKNNLPVIMTAHTTVRGCDFAGHENSSEYTVGGIDSYELEDMGEGYDYLALGHIHHGQFVHSRKNIARYSGSPVQVSFDEDYRHSVSIVEIERKGEKPVVREIEIKSCQPLVTLPVKGVATWEDAKELLENYPDDIQSYIRLNVEVDDFLPAEAYEEALLICKDKECKLCVINSRSLKKKRRDANVMSVQEFRAEEPVGIAERYAEYKGIEFDSDMKEMFEEILAILKDESRR